VYNGMNIDMTVSRQSTVLEDFRTREVWHNTQIYVDKNCKFY